MAIALIFKDCKSKIVSSSRRALTSASSVCNFEGKESLLFDPESQFGGRRIDCSILSREENGKSSYLIAFFLVETKFFAQVKCTKLTKQNGGE